jgi:DNA-binding XRE family transcriptional regulator
VQKWVTVFVNIGKMKNNRVRQFREAIPLSIAELSRRAGLAPQTITKMEKGLSTRKNSELKVAKALQKKYEEVFISDTEI